MTVVLIVVTIVLIVMTIVLIAMTIVLIVMTIVLIIMTIVLIVMTLVLMVMTIAMSIVLIVMTIVLIVMLLEGRYYGMSECSVKVKLPGEPLQPDPDENPENAPEYCKCGCCVAMPTQLENKCCTQT
jgi:hypothetical protein